MVTLSIKNLSGKTLEFPTVAGAVKIEAGASKDLSEKQLTSPLLAEALQSGTAVVDQANPTDEQKALARTVLPALITGTNARLIQLKGRFDQSQQELVKLREAFNRTRKIVEQNLDLAKTAVAGWPHLRDVATRLVLKGEAEDPTVTEKKQALADAEKALEGVKAEAPDARPREEWFADRAAREAAVKAAREALAAVTKEKANPLVGDIETVNAAVAAVLAIAKDKAIGGEIPELRR